MSHSVDLLLAVLPNIAILLSAWARFESRLSKLETSVQAFGDRLTLMQSALKSVQISTENTDRHFQDS
jgi:hypothetical protein